jgi:hypothetical protein
MTLPSTEPEFSGSKGRAWFVPMTELRHDGTRHSTLAAYLLESPHFHPHWSRWLLSVIHLRPVPGVCDAVIRLPGATHEIMIASLDPDHYGDHATLPPASGFHMLRPLDVVEQFIVPADQFAMRLLRIGVQACCDGISSPDSDYRYAWHMAIKETAASYCGGKESIGLA